MNASSLILLVVACVATSASAPAQVQPVFGSAESIDSTVLNADIVVVGRVVDFRDAFQLDGREVQTSVLAVEETLKGEHQERRSVRLAHSRSPLAHWTGHSIRRLLVTAKGDALIESRVIDLADEALEVFTVDFTLLRKPADVIRQAKEAIRRMPGVRQIDTFSLYLPREQLTGTKWTTYSGITLSVPVDGRLEKRAHEYLGSKNDWQRREAVQALRYFKSDENIARVKPLLSDPAWGYQERVEDNWGIEVRFYGVRQAAYETLQYWGVPAEKPVLREKVEKLDSVEAVVFSDNDENELTDAALKDLVRFKNLKHVYLNDSALTDAQLKLLGAYTRLESLNASNTQVTDAGLKNIAGLKNLRSLQLDVTKVTDAGLAELAAFPHLEHLYLSQTLITNAGLKALAGLKNLAVLDLTATLVSDDALADLAKLPSLKELYLRETDVTDSGVARLQKLRPELKIHR